MVRISGAAEMRARLQKTADRARRLEAFLQRETASLRALCAQAFAERRSPMGDAWPPTRDPSSAASILATVAIVARPGGALTIQVTHPAAGYFVHGRQGQPGRNFLPLEVPSMQPAERGAAGEWWSGHRARAKAFIESAEELSP